MFDVFTEQINDDDDDDIYMLHELGLHLIVEWMRRWEWGRGCALWGWDGVPMEIVQILGDETEMGMIFTTVSLFTVNVVGALIHVNCQVFHCLDVTCNQRYATLCDLHLFTRLSYAECRTNVPYLKYWFYRKS